MNTAPQELLKEYVKSQHFTSTAEIMAAMKEMFRDVVQTAMEVELDEELGRERCQRAEASNTAPNYRNSYSRKTVKTQLGEIEIKVPRDRNGTFEPKLIGKYSRNTDGMEEKILALYASGISRSRSRNCTTWRSPWSWYEDHAGGDGVAKPAFREDISLPLHGRHPL